MKDKEYVNIRITRETVDTLKEIGKKSETYDDLINRLIEARGIVPSTIVTDKTIVLKREKGDD